MELYDSGNTLKDRFTYSYGFAGELLSETDLGARVHSFSYDSLYRLKMETHPDFGPAGSGQSLEYRYDANGNRTQKIVNGGVGANGYTDYYGVDGRDRLWWVNRRNGEPTSGQPAPYTIFNYDVNGRVSYRERLHTDGTTLRKHAFIWDSDDRLKWVWRMDSTPSPTGLFNALYDEEGLRVQKIDVWTGTHDYSWGPGGIVHDTAGPSYTPGLHQQAGGTDRFFHSDWLGSTRYLSDGAGTSLPSGLRYDAFGNRSATTGAGHPTDFQFAGAWGYQQEYQTASDPGVGLQYLEQRCAPQYRALNPWFNQERFGRSTFGSTDYLAAKAKGNHRLSVTRRGFEDV